MKKNIIQLFLDKLKLLMYFKSIGSSMKILFLSILLFAGVANSQTLEKWVARYGDDSNSGTELNPYKTVKKALTVINASSGYTNHLINILLDNDPDEDPQIFEEEPWSINKNNTSLIGEVYGALKPIIEFTPTSTNQKMAQINATHVSIKNLEFDFQNVNQDGGTYGIFAQSGSDYTTIENCYLYNSEVTPLTFKNCSSCSVYSNIFGPITQDGSAFSTRKANTISFEADVDNGCDDNEIYWNTIYPNNSHYPINFLHGGQFSSYYSYRNDIDGNRIEGGWTGIFLSNQKDFHVHNNLIYEAKGFSLNTSDPPGVVFDETIDGYGIHIGNASGFTNTWDAGDGAIYNNVLYGNYNVGFTNFKASGVAIINNIFMNNALSGSGTNNWHTFSNYYLSTDPSTFANNLYYTTGSGNNQYLRWKYDNEYDNDPNTTNGIWGSLESNPYIDEDPQLIDPGNYDFEPESGAFVIDAGYDIVTNGYLASSFNGVERPQGSAVDVGAYEAESSESLLRLLSAELTSSNTVELTFSQDLDSSSLARENFYIAKNKVKDVELVNSKKIKLKTSIHNSKKYNIIFLNNIKAANSKGLLKQFNSAVYSSENLGKNNNEIENIVTDFYLFQNYPNPFNPSTKISYSIPKQNLVELKIYDVLGSEVHSLVNEIKEPGQYEVDFNASHLASGVYFYALKAGDFYQTKKLLLLK